MRPAPSYPLLDSRFACVSKRPKTFGFKFSSLLDENEPTAQLSPKLADVIFDKIVELRDDYDITPLLVEQNAKKALEISDNGYMFVSGRVAYGGSAKSLLEHEKFQSYFLGIVNEDV